MTTDKFEKHTKRLGWIFILISIFYIPLGIAIAGLLIFTGIVSNDQGAFNFLAVTAAIFGGIIVLIGISGIFAGVGLLKRKFWGWRLAVIVGILNLYSIPIGTAIGFYTAHILLQKSAPEYFD